MREELPPGGDDRAAAAPWWGPLVAVAWPAIVLVLYARSVLLPLLLDLLP